jgi:hypothetical protein
MLPSPALKRPGPPGRIPPHPRARAAVPTGAVPTAFADADRSYSGIAPTRDVTAECLSPVPKLAPTAFLCRPWQRARRRGRRDRRSSSTCAGHLPVTSALKASKRVHAITSQASALPRFPILRAPCISPRAPRSFSRASRPRAASPREETAEAAGRAAPPPSPTSGHRRHTPPAVLRA